MLFIDVDIPICSFDGKRNTTNVFFYCYDIPIAFLNCISVVVYSDIPIIYFEGKRNKTHFVFTYSHIPMVYPNGKSNNTNNVLLNLIFR